MQINDNFCAQTLDFFRYMHYYIIVLECDFLGKRECKKIEVKL